MTLAVEAAAGPPAPPYRQSKLSRWLESLESDDRVAAEAVLADSSWTHRAVCDLFARHGLNISERQIANDRRGRDGNR